MFWLKKGTTALIMTLLFMTVHCSSYRVGAHHQCNSADGKCRKLNKQTNKERESPAMPINFWPLLCKCKILRLKIPHTINICGLELKQLLGNFMSGTFAFLFIIVLWDLIIMFRLIYHVTYDKEYQVEIKIALYCNHTIFIIVNKMQINCLAHQKSEYKIMFP